MRIIVVTGGRRFANRAVVTEALRQARPDLVITGGASGADALADAAARDLGIDRLVIPANWLGRGKGAGPIRNRRMAQVAKLCRMLDGFDDAEIVLVAFQGGTGTADMTSVARRNDFTIDEIS